ncbi:MULTISPECIES: hypothetical protein [unclassified Nocardia]|uniref:hypothetical protein n=1 Tax=unclassified Nocardia TaxID=2637762 RepID=UPI00278C7DC5|nr:MULTISPECIES: hypothetical protein [unclassified Nocardia]
MTNVTAIRAIGREHWSSITVPYGAKLVWATMPIPPDQVGGGTLYTWWEVPDLPSPITQTALIRVVERPFPYDNTPESADAGLAGASAFVDDRMLLWTYTGSITGTYPPNDAPSV